MHRDTKRQRKNHQKSKTRPLVLKFTQLSKISNLMNKKYILSEELLSGDRQKDRSVLYYRNLNIILGAYQRSGSAVFGPDARNFGT